MQSVWQILLCDESDKSCNITGFIESLPREGQIKALKFIELLAEKGPQLRRPYSDLLYEGIHELRFRLGKNYVRMLYFFVYGSFIILTFGFNKKTDRTPDKLVKRVITYKDRILRDYTEADLKENLDAPI